SRSRAIGIRFSRRRPCGRPPDLLSASAFCGRGGTGRRAALRSLWGQPRGRSRLLDRTNAWTSLTAARRGAPPSNPAGMADDPFDQMAFESHRHPVPGKLAVVATKRLSNQRDLALAYSPGVAVACNAIVRDPGAAAEVTGGANLVGVVTNGTAVLGLG